jgi:hypothetical protein
MTLWHFCNCNYDNGAVFQLADFEQQGSGCTLWHVFVRDPPPQFQEVGVGYGLHSLEVLATTDVDMLYMVDPMRPYDPQDLFDTTTIYLP